MTALYARLLEALGIVAAVLLGLSALLVCADVALRNLGSGLAWAVEVTEYILPAATFLAAPWVLHQGAHVRIELLLANAPRPVARALDAGADLLGLAISAVFVWYSLRVIAQAQATGALVIKNLVFPESWLFVPVPLCFALMGIEFARRLAR